MIEEGKAVDGLAKLVNRYHEIRDKTGIDAPAAEWVRAEISGARAILEDTFGADGCHQILAKVRQHTKKGIPHRDREWHGSDSEAQREE